MENNSSQMTETPGIAPQQDDIPGGGTTPKRDVQVMVARPTQSQSNSANKAQTIDVMQGMHDRKVPTQQEENKTEAKPSRAKKTSTEEKQPKEKKSKSSTTTIATIAIILAALVAVGIFVIPGLLHKEPAPVNPDPNNDPQPPQQAEYAEPQKLSYSLPYQIKNLEELNVRSGPGTQYKIERVIKKVGSVIDVYEEKNSGGYLWRRIGTDQWIADDGTWTEMLDNGKGVLADFFVKTSGKGEIASALGYNCLLIDHYSFIGSVTRNGDSYYAWRLSGAGDMGTFYVGQGKNKTVYCDTALSQKLGLTSTLLYNNGQAMFTR